jgi:hypothetical protein
MNIAFARKLGLFMVIALAGCASAEITTTHPYTGQMLPKPNRILVYDFTSNLNEVPASSPLRNQLAGSITPRTAQQSETSRQLGAQIAQKLVTEIQSMGLFASRVGAQTIPRDGDIVFKGYFLSMDEGSATERMALGFGSGSAELKVTVEGYQMTAEGLRFLGSGESVAGSGKTPGAALGVAVTVATANPIGLLANAAVKGAGEATGSETIEGAANRTSKLIGERLQVAFQNQGWI